MKILPMFGHLSSPFFCEENIISRIMLLCIIYRYECTRLLGIFLSSCSNDIVFSKSIVHFAVAYIPEHLRSPSVCGRVRVV